MFQAGVFLFILLGATCGILIYFFRKERDGKSAVTLMKFMSGTSTKRDRIILVLGKLPTQWIANIFTAPFLKLLLP